MPNWLTLAVLYSIQIEFRYSGINVPNDFSASHSAFYKLVATDVAMPEAFRGYTTFYQCLAEDDGASQCARHCSTNLKDDLVSFSVTGHIAPPPPPSPDAPPEPPAPPPSPLPTYENAFNGASDACSNAGVYEGMHASLIELSHLSLFTRQHNSHTL